MIIIPAILERWSSLKDRSTNLVFNTNELTPEQYMGIGQLVQQFGYLAFKLEIFSEREKKAIEDLKASYDDHSKTPSQRLRSVLYRTWEQENEGFEDFNLYYLNKMESLVTHFKSKLK